MGKTSDVIYTADRVWDGTSSDVVDRGFVDVDGPTIRAVSRTADLPADATVTDLGDVTLMPGLINAHVHTTFCASTIVLDDYLRERDAGTEALIARAEDNLSRAVAVGVTTVRDLGTLNDVVFTMQSRIRDGAFSGPDIVAAGEGITSHGGHCHFFGIEVEGVDNVRAAVRRQHDAGADLIKIFATGGNLTPGTDPFSPQYSLEELKACVDEARSFDMQVAAHAHAPEGIRRAVGAEVNTIEHCMFETADGVDFDERVAERMAELQITCVPTLGIAISRLAADPALLEEIPPARRAIVTRLLSKGREFTAAFNRMHEMGVPMIAGTDAGIPQRHFDDFPADIQTYSEPVGGIGVALGRVGGLKSATSECARRLGLDDRGILAAGKRADLLAVAGNPLDRVSDLTQTRFVMVAGRVAVEPAAAE